MGTNMIRKQNLDLVKRIMFTNQKMVASEIGKEAGLSVVTTNSLIKELLEDQVIMEGEVIQPPMGRPAIEYVFNADHKHSLLLSIQNNRSNLCIVAKLVNLYGEEKQEWLMDYTEVSLDRLIAAILTCLNDSECQVANIALSIPGKVFNDEVTSSWGQQFTGWRIKEVLARHTDIPISIQNDAHLTTIGYFVRQNDQLKGTIVGIYFPKESSPGITIFSNHTLIEGNLGLAGEGKYLPFLMDKNPPQTDQELVDAISEVISFYNAALAPNFFVISSIHLSEDLVVDALDRNGYLRQHPNEPTILIDTSFQESMTSGLRWLANENTPYHL
ncbi:ROK family protein [Alkalicoccobacillus gibsonii]|uniref:ROK family protein n=1 Tax=Alkalicoccobacillus gibsonii TaxID=79881 RepID=A0ABU9VDD6_9BACI